MDIDRNGVVNVYLSHAAEHGLPAAVLKEQLKACGNGRINFVGSGALRNIVSFDDEIEELLGRTDWFVLILTEPSANWDWCLYEAGIYGARMNDHNRMICLHAPEVSPLNSISGFEAVQLVHQEIEDFLREVCHNPPLPELAPFNPELGGKADELSAMAHKICQSMTRDPVNELGNWRPQSAN